MSHDLSSRNTDSFHELLDKAGASLLLSTPGRLVVVRSEPAGVNTHFLDFDGAAGIAWKPGQLAVGAASRIVTWRNLPAAAAKAGQGEAADACYLPRAVHTTGAIDVHEMGYDVEGMLWFVNTHMSCLATPSPDYSFEPRWRPPFVSAWDMGDRCHLNGLGFRDGRPRYVSMLAASDRAGGWRAEKVSGGRVMDIEGDAVLADQLCMPHSPRWHRGRLWFLCAGAGQLMSLEPGRPPQVVAELPGFARGLDFIERYALVGLSQMRANAAFAGLPLGRRVAERRSGVWVVDTDSGQTVAFLEFTGAVREVTALKLLPHRYPAVLEPDTPLAATTFELPDAVLANLAPPDRVEEAVDAATRLHMDGRFDEAVAGYRAVLAERPEHARANLHLGLCMVDAGRWQEGERQLARVAAADPGNVEAINSLGLCRYRLGDLPGGLQTFERAIAIDPEFAQAHFNRGIALLKLGRYAEAWPEYDWRWKTPRFVPFQCSKPLWQGEDISDRVLLVHSEQGNGDHVQFMRFLPMVAGRCRELVYVGPESLAPLAALVPGVSESRVPGQIPGDRFDAYCPLMSLPRWLGITLENLPSPERYLRIPPQVVVRELHGDFRVGLAWAGSPTQQDDALRSMPPQQLAPLLDVPGATFYSLQLPVDSAAADWLERHGITNLEPELPGYARTAALVDQLDLVISVDTAIAHVAAALGKQTWMLLSHDPDWRWLREGDRSPWYPSMRLFRQARAGEWPEPVARVREALAARVDAGAQRAVR